MSPQTVSRSVIRDMHELSTHPNPSVTKAAVLQRSVLKRFATTNCVTQGHTQFGLLTMRMKLNVLRCRADILGTI